MADKKLSAYDVLTALSVEDLFVVLQSIGSGQYANKNISLSSLLESTLANIKASGNAALGTSAKFIRSDHVHPFMKTVPDNTVLDTILESGEYTGRILANFAANAPQGTFNATLGFTMRVVETLNNFRFQFYQNDVASTLPEKYKQPSMFVRRYSTDTQTWSAWEDFAGANLFMKAMTGGLGTSGGTQIVNLTGGQVSTIQLAAGSYRYQINGGGGGGGGGTSSNRRGGVGGAGGSLTGAFWLPFAASIQAYCGAGGSGGSNSGASANGGGGGGGIFSSGASGGGGGASGGAGGASGSVAGGAAVGGSSNGNQGSTSIKYGAFSGGVGGAPGGAYGTGGNGGLVFTTVLTLGGNGGAGRNSDGDGGAGTAGGNTFNLNRGSGGAGGTSGQGGSGGTGGSGVIQIWKTA
jgi:hypothetical protein